MSPSDIEARLRNLPGWEQVEAGGRPVIQKVFRTGDFLRGLAFVTRVAVLAETANHHPDVTLTYPRVTIQLTTHDAGGITDRDFDLAAKIDGLTF